MSSLNQNQYLQRHLAICFSHAIYYEWNAIHSVLLCSFLVSVCPSGELGKDICESPAEIRQYSSGWNSSFPLKQCLVEQGFSPIKPTGSKAAVMHKTALTHHVLNMHRLSSSSSLFLSSFLQTLQDSYRLQGKREMCLSDNVLKTVAC